LFAGSTVRFGVRRALLAFAVTDSIPPLARIDSVQLVLSCDRTTSGPGPTSLHRVLQDWGEAGSSSSGGGGDFARPNDATWSFAFYDVTPWTTPGGTFTATASAAASVDQAGLYVWGSTAALVEDVQAWLDEPATNFGWILVGDEPRHSAKRFHSRQSEVADQRPALRIDFSPPTAVQDVTWGGIKLLYAPVAAGAVNSQAEVQR
jgi:hypothetical protein